MIKLKINTGALKASQQNNNNNNSNSQNSSSSASGAGAGTGAGPRASSPPPPPPASASAASPSVVPKIRFKNIKKSGNTSKASTAPSTPASKISKSSATGSTSKASTTKLKPILTALANNANDTSITHPPITLKTPKLKLKAAPVRPKKRNFEPGLGYDSEASDREDDPLIEEQFILRMKPGPDCDFLREVIESKQLDSTTDVWFKFKENRKAVVSVRGNIYAALLVDLPCIIESSKTIDKKAIFKTADICQMLLVGDRIPSEDAIFGIHYKPSDLIYPHGLTPPLQYVRKRRFRKRVSNRTIEAVEAEVDRLLALDQEAEISRYELLDAEQLMHEEEAGDEGYDMLGQAGGDVTMGDGGGTGDAYNDEDAEGEEDYDMDEDDLALQMESALMGGDADPDADAEGEIDEDAVMAVLNGTANSSTTNKAEAAGASEDEEEDDEEEDGDEDEDGFDAEGEGDDESAQETAAQSQKIREEIADLEAAYKSGLREMEKMQNPIMKQRKQAALERIVKELEFKRSTVGIGSGGMGL